MTLKILPLLEHTNNNNNIYKMKPTTPMLLDDFTINHNLRFVKKIGAGTYGLIYLVEDIYSKKQYAAKMILKKPPAKSSNIDVNENKKFIQSQIYQYFADHHQQNQSVIAQELNLDFIANEGVHCPFLKEIALHLKVHQHPNVITIHKVLNLENLAIIILMDYFEQGDLFNNIIDKKIFTECPSYQDQQLLMKNCMLQLIDGLAYCSLKNIYHCDLKPENIMINYNKNYHRNSNSPIIDYNEIHIVLIDFGLAMNSNLICCNACRGSSYYMAPERITNFNTSSLIKSMINLDQFQTIDSSEASSSKYLPTLAGDIWSLGVLFINITCARNPWPIADINDEKQVFANYTLHNKNILSSILPISLKFNRLLDSIFELNPNDRISLKKLSSKIVDCDFFYDDSKPLTITPKKLSFNGQLFTPPETSVSDFCLCSDAESVDAIDEYMGFNRGKCPF